MTQQSNEPKIGDHMPDGTVYGGISPDTGKPMYAMPQDALRPYYDFNRAKDYAAELVKFSAYAHNDWRVPTKNELNMLFNNRAAIGGFDISGAHPGSWYWSSSQNDGYGNVWAQRFSDGFQNEVPKENAKSLRCVR